MLATSCSGGPGTTATTTAGVESTTPATADSTSTSDSTSTTIAESTSTTEEPSGPPPFTGAIQAVDQEALAHSWQPGCPIGPGQLATVEVSYVDFDGRAHQGTIVVHADHAEPVIQVFSALYETGYPMVSMVPIGQLPPGAEDQPGYSNTSGFHCRFVAGTTRWSEHAVGRAIDINPHLNPFIRGDEIWPSGSEPYLDRTLGLPGMITEGDAVVSAFDSIGWGWGGRWRTLKDYHHFSSTGR